MVPLLPGYLSYATGLSGVDLEQAQRGRMVLGSFLFVLGFSFVFVSFGALFGVARRLAVDLPRARSAVVPRAAHDPASASPSWGWCRWLQRDVRIHRVPAVGLAAAPLLGVLFGLGWTPCIGPTLSAVQALAVNEGTAGRGAVLSFAYSPRARAAVPDRRPRLPPHARRGAAGCAATRSGSPASAG